jgi:hypothetical protein
VSLSSREQCIHEAEIVSWGSGYYEFFPPKSMNVSVKASEDNDSQIRKKVLVVDKDFNPGDVIYKVSLPYIINTFAPPNHL